VAHDVHVERRRRVLEREQADPNRPLEEGRTVRRVAFREGCGEGRVRDDEALDDDPLALDADLGRGAGMRDRCGERRRQGEDSGFHAPHPAEGV
jgi:hypothetical protein